MFNDEEIKREMHAYPECAEQALLNVTESCFQDLFAPALEQAGLERYINHHTRLVDKRALKDVLKDAKIIRSISADGFFETFYIKRGLGGLLVVSSNLYEEVVGLVEIPLADPKERIDINVTNH